MSTKQTDFSVNLSEVIEEMFLVLTDKEKDVIVKRFSLDNQPKRTLESIGKSFSVTRERIRQIEKIALGKLKRTVQTTRLSLVNELAGKIIKENGGLLAEKRLIAEIVNTMGAKDVVDANIIKLALNINPEIENIYKIGVYSSFWKMAELSMALIESVVKTGIKVLDKKGDVMTDVKLIIQIRQLLGEKIEGHIDPMILSALEVDKRIKRLKVGFGLMSWRHINPRSIRDKAYIVLKEEKKPLHFVEIANKISEAGFDKKIVTIQAVHNELIRYDQFVLVGRGLYGLKEFGYKKGTVTDIIEDLLKKNSPLSKQEIIDGVLKQRHVKKGTISLNLQKNSQFIRVGRAVYAFDKKTK
jgi:hypothetical protein